MRKAMLQTVEPTRTEKGRYERPTTRRLRGYAFDPSLSVQLETMLVNEVTFKVPWEELSYGPIGEYLEVVDYDPSSASFYAPVNLNDSLVLAQDGLPPSEGNPHFHQQMVYAVGMTTIRNFERGLGRVALWAPTRERGNDPASEYVQRLRIYPHALREANAYYSPAKKALLFGYFPAVYQPEGSQLPGGTVFTCLSHDIIAHETTHALLDGMHRLFIEPSHPDALAFHEAFADIVALFQHFSFPEVLEHQIRETRGDLAARNLLGQLAIQFGQAIGHYGALRSAIGRLNPKTLEWELIDPDPSDYQTVMEPHARGAILVAAVFDAYLAIYQTRVEDLFRLATGGTGVLPQGAIHPDLVTRLSAEAAKTARQVLNMCIRALDYCPPVDINFGDYLRALITADSDVMPDDDRRYRVAFIEAFRRRGIFPSDVRTLAVESLRWSGPKDDREEQAFSQILEQMQNFTDRVRHIRTRQELFLETVAAKRRLHRMINQRLKDPEQIEQLTGLVLSPDRELPGLRRSSSGKPRFEVHSLRPAVRIGQDENLLNQIIVSLVQTRDVDLDQDPKTGIQNYRFRGGCTLIFNMDTYQLEYRIVKAVDDESRLDYQRNYINQVLGGSLRATYFDKTLYGGQEPFALLHRS
jgi:hypothetical protein